MLSKLFGFGLRLEETEDTVNISGFNGITLGDFITRVWKTSVLEKHMFKTLIGGSRGRFEFYRFFTIDILYMLDTLAKQRNQRIPARTLNQISELIKTKSWFKDTERPDIPGKLDFSRLKDFNYTPKEYQQRWLEYYDKIPTRYHLNGALLSAAPGSGKSAMSMFTMHCANVDRIIVVCPKNALHRVWVDDVNRMFKTPPKQWTSDRTDTPDEDTKLFVYHYEAIERAMQHHSRYFGKYNYGLVLDESHNMNDVKSQRTQAWLSLCKLSGSSNIIHASGTPFKALGSESIPLLRAIDPMFTPKVEDAYKKIYGASAQKGLDILRNRLGLVSFTVLKEELGLEKPNMNTLPIKIPDGKKYTLTAVREVMKKFIEGRARYYKAREKEDMAFYIECLNIHENKIRGNRRMEAEFEYYKRCVRQIQQTIEYGMISEQITFCKKYEFTVISNSLPKDQVRAFRSVCSIIKYLPLKIQGECLGQVVGRMRIEAHVAMCKNIPFQNICESTKKKTVVFTSYVNVLEEAYEVCKQQSLQPIVVYAKTNSNLASMVSDFEKKENVNPLIATYDSLSTAVPLTMADNMIMINAPFRAYIQEQAISRIHRLNQDSQTVVWQCYLDTGVETNISSRSLDIMQWSQQQVEAITGVKSPYTLEDAEDGSVKVATEGFEDDTLTHYVSLKEDGCVSVENVDTVNTNISKRVWVWGA